MCGRYGLELPMIVIVTEPADFITELPHHNDPSPVMFPYTELPSYLPPEPVFKDRLVTPNCI